VRNSLTQQLFKRLRVRQNVAEVIGQVGAELVRGYTHWVLHSLEGILDHLVTFLFAKHNTHGGVLVGHSLLVVEHVQIEIKLTGISGLETASELTVVEQQVDKELLVIDQ
jgi:hypothetical protein